MTAGIERLLVPVTYGAGVVLWAVVLGVLLARLRRPPEPGRLFAVLVVVLAIDAFRTLFENLYFGAYWNAVYGVLPAGLRVLLETPELVVVPRLVNLLAGALVLFLLVWRWLPAMARDRSEIARRLAESVRDVEAARDRHRRIVDASPDLVLALDDGGRIAGAGARCQTLLGLEPDALVGRHLAELVVPAERAAFEAAFARVLAGADRFGETIETRLATTGGPGRAPGDSSGRDRGLPVAWRFARLAEGGFCAVARDETVSRAHGLLEAAVSHLEDILFITEAPTDGSDQYRIVYVNEAFTRQTGYLLAEALGRTPSGLLHGPDTDPVEVERLRAGRRAGQPVSGQLLHYARDGRTYWAEIRIAPIPVPSGKPTHFTSIMRDITRHKEAIEALALGEERLRIIASLTTDIVWDWDIVTDRIWRSGRGAPSLAYRPGEMTEAMTSWQQRIHPDDLPPLLESLRTAIDGGADQWEREYRLRRADGGYAQVAAKGRVLRDSAGRAVRMVGSGIDVTRQRAREEAARQSQKLEAVGQLTGGVAHDFNNILMVIMANVDAVLDDQAEGLPVRLEDALQHLARIGGAAQRAAQLTRQLLAFSRRQSLRPERVDVGELVQSTASMLGRTLGEHIAIETRLAPGLPPVLVDRAQLETAILNICLNARDAMPRGGTLTLATSLQGCLRGKGAGEGAARITGLAEEETPARPGDDDTTAGRCVVLSVTDTGTGMAPDIAARAFEPFFTTKEVGRGSGLGLSMVYGFVTQSNGFVEIASRPMPDPGHGTTVNLCLPAAPGAEDAPADPPDEATRLPRGAERLLVVEDEASVRTLVVAQLESLGYAVTQARNGIEALALLRGDPTAFDLVLSDVVMPGDASGDTVAEEARRLRPDLPVILMSGYPESLAPGSLIPRDRVLLAKPFRRAELAQAIRKALATRVADA